MGGKPWVDAMRAFIARVRRIAWAEIAAEIGSVLLCLLIIAADLMFFGGALRDSFAAIAALGGTKFIECLLAAFSCFAQLLVASGITRELNATIRRLTAAAGRLFELLLR
jgi:hypothetical protein